MGKLCTIKETSTKVINIKVNVQIQSKIGTMIVMKKDSDCSDKKHDDACSILLERQVNNPANDVTNFPRITQSETSIAHFKDFILYGFNDSNAGTGGLGTFSFSGFAFSNDLGNTWTDGGSLPVNPGG